MLLILQCAWCGKVLGSKEVQTRINEPKSISHTICPECSAVVLKEIHETGHETNEYYYIP
jgi:phage FluMu protein Com